jgi:NADPH:quinone reductase-like Zn-dependent oxidoreductase
MALPSTQKQWILCGTEKGLDEWQFRDGPVPEVGNHGVLVKMHAAGLNYREVLIPAVCSMVPLPSSMQPWLSRRGLQAP